MASGNMVKLVVELLADAKNFAGELDKGTAAVKEMADKAAKDLSKVTTDVAAATTEAVTDINAGLEKGASEVEEFAAETADAMSGVATNVADEVVEATTAMDKGFENVESAVDEMKTETIADAEEMGEGIETASETATEAVVDGAGKMRDAQGRFIKQGADEGATAIENAANKSKRSFTALAAAATVAGVKIGIEIAKGATKAANAVRQTADRIANDMSAAGRKMAMFGAALSGAVTLGLGGATKAAAGFERSMAEVISLLNAEQRTPAFIETLRRGIDDIAIKFAVDAPDAIKATYDAISSGVEPAKVLEFLNMSAKGAVGGVSSLADASGFLANVMNSYGMKSADAAEQQRMLAEVMDLTFAAIKGGKTTFPELSKDIADVAPFAAQAGMSFKDLTIAIATITLTGKRTPETMTSIKAALMGLGQQMPKTQQVAKELGIQFDLQAMKSKGLNGMLKELGAALEKSGGKMNIYKTKVDKTGKVTRTLDFETEGVMEALIALTGSAESAAGWAALLANNGETAAAAMDAANNSAGALDDAVNAMTSNDPTFAWRQAWQAFAAVMRDVGRAVLAYLQPIIPHMLKIAELVRKWSQENSQIIATIVAVTSAAGAFGVALTVVGLAMTAVAAIISALATVGLPFILTAIVVLLPVFASLAFAAALVVTNFTQIRDWVFNNFPAIRNAVVVYAQQIWVAMRDAAVKIWHAFQTYGTMLVTWIKSHMPQIRETIAAAVDWITTKLIPAVGAFVVQFIERMKSVFDWFVENWPKIREVGLSVIDKLVIGFNALWGAVKLVWEALDAVWNILKMTGVVDFFISLMDNLFYIMEGIAWVFNAVAREIRAMNQAMRDFRIAPSWEKFWRMMFGNIIVDLVAGKPKTNAMRAPTGAGGMNAMRAPGVGGGLPAALTSSMATAAETNQSAVRGDEVYNITINQNSNESADDMLKRMSRELRFRRGF